MIHSKNKVSGDELETQMVNVMMKSLASIYSNKSSDEYKSHGDITVSSEYKTIETMVANLNTIKGFPANEASNIKTLFLTLHRPVFKTMVTEYIATPDERNIVFTAVYTVGFRVLVGELSRIYASTEATDKGIKYNPDKVSRKNDMARFIATFNGSLEKRINDNIRALSALQQESFVESVGDIIDKGVPIVKKCIKRVFGIIKGANPLSLINSIIMQKYDFDVEHLDLIANLYNATYDAYKEYMRIPESQRKEKVESKYIKNIEKYKIKMDNIKAKIEHYDQRAIEEAKDKVEDAIESNSTKTDSTPSNDNNNDNDYGF